MSGTKGVIGRIDKTKPTVVWGAGVSGLLIAYFLKKNDIDIIVKEKKSFPGGKISTAKYKSNIIEQGANAIFLNADVYNLINELNLAGKIIVPSKKLKRFISKNYKVFSIASQIPFCRGVLNLLRSTPEYKRDLTIAAFLRPWLGSKALLNLVDPALGGIYAAKSDEILLSSFFNFNESTYPHNYWQFIKGVFKKRKSSTSTSISGSVGFVGGMHTFIEALAEQLKGKIFLNCSDDPNFIDHNNIICADIEGAQKILQNFPEWVSELKKIQYNSLSSNTVLLKNQIQSLHEAFGVVFAENKKGPPINSLGVLVNHNVFPENYDGLYSYTMISNKVYRSKDELISDLSTFDSSIVESNIEYISTSNFENGLPVYDYTRELAVSRLHEISARQIGICLFGNYVAGISIREMIIAAQEFAAKNSMVQNEQ